MIIKSALAGELLGYTAGENDALITTLIPIIQDKIVDYCNNSFLTDIYLNDTMTFTASTNTITGDFPTAGFKIKDNIKIFDSDYNDGFAEILEISSTQIKVDKELTTEETSVTVRQVKFPESLKLLVVDLLRYYLSDKGKLVKSESMPSGYSVTYKDESEIMRPFNQFRKIYK